jgi:hypothetical protein
VDSHERHEADAAVGRDLVAGAARDPGQGHDLEGPREHELEAVERHGGEDGDGGEAHGVQERPPCLVSLARDPR